MCGSDVEDECHFLLHCPAYHSERQALFQELRQISAGVVDLSCMCDDMAKMRLLIGCGCANEHYDGVMNCVCKKIGQCRKYRDMFVLAIV